MEGREMAYNPTTWNTDEVITKDKLNKIEQGLHAVSKLSGIDIDADKDWGGKNITNLGYITANKIRPVASTEVRVSGKTSCTIPEVYCEGTVLIKAQALAEQVGTVKINGVVAFTWGPTDSGALVEKIWPIKGGDVVTFHTTTTAGCSISCSDAPPIIYPAPPTW